MLWERSLEPLGFDIRKAANLADAKIQAKRIPPSDLILLDLRLPDSNDASTIASIEELKALNPDCVVLVISGFLTPDLSKLAIEQGAASAIEKLSVTRAADLWEHFKRAIGNKGNGVQKRLACTMDLIERLSKLPLI